MTKKADLIKLLKDSHAAMQAVVEITRADENIYPPWKMKEILAHLAGWDDLGILNLRALAAGEIPPTPAARGFDIYNAETVSTRESLSYEQTCREWHNTRLDFIQILEGADDAVLDETVLLPIGTHGTMAQMIGGFAGHEISHATEIRGILEKK